MTEHTHTHNDSPTSTVIPASETAERMAAACANLLETLTPALRRKTEFPFEAAERQRWHYIPREMFDRKGVYLQEMNQKQRDAAFNLLATGLSRTGYQKATAIIDLEATLGEAGTDGRGGPTCSRSRALRLQRFWRSNKSRALGVAGGGTPRLAPLYRCESGVDYTESVLLWL